ncbi:exosome RNA helicase MTR4 [Leptosomus discolor]
MADAFGDELFSVFEEDSAAAAAGAKKTKAGATEGARRPGKRSEEKSGVAVTGKPKREADADSTEDAVLGKKPKLEDVVSEDANLADLMPQVKVQAVETVEGCTHEVALPADEDFTGLKPRTGKAAKEYPFILDAFQREAILCVDNNQSVLVSAHTSAGKTVCAEYAIALALREKQRVIFTSPIKALSNQKYREMYEEFQDVGLMTGDVTINPTASCLVMTTEILRSMLYRGSEVMREVAWVIFDEIHYMRDSERGVVWEETIILLPDNVHYVFLSATIPNARQFAEWICHLHKQPCHVIYTDYRPTPLQHYIFPAGGDGLHLVVDENGDFREDNFNTAMQVLRDAGDLAKGDQKGRKGGTKGPSNVFKIVKMIMERNFQPVIIFSFSKKDCEAYALQMTKLDFNTDEEKKMVEEVFNNAIDCLSDEDKKLPQVEHVLPLLKRGIGIHHGGLLPILKETIEILFSEGLIKALFATETFAMGINMPARTVLFTSASKFDGKDFRWVVPVLVHLLSAISSVRLYIPKDLRPVDNRQSVLKSIQEVQKRFPDGVPLLDPIDDMGIKDQGLKKVIQKVEAFEHRMYSHPVHNDPNLETVYKLCEKKAQIAMDIRAAKRELKKARTVLQMDELKCRKRVLRRLGFATSSDVIEMKGRVACEISSADELLLTEMMFNGLFNDLSAEQATALLSCFVFQENSSEMPKLTEQLAGPLRQMQECAKRIAKVSAEAKLEIDEENYLNSFRPNLMDVVYTWANGANFAHICKMTDVFEGSIIRCMRRLEELLRQMCQAAKAIGNTELENKFAEGITKIKRDIVFAASLYL